MVRAKILAIVIVLVSTICTAKGAQKRLGVTLDVTYRSRSISKGIVGYGSSPVLLETIDVDLWDSGFGMSVTHQWATNSGWVSKDRFKYAVYYKGSVFDDTLLHTKYRVRWRYKSYYKRPAKSKDSQEWQVKFSWPEILQVENLFPYYTVYYEYPAGRNYDNHRITGWLHMLGLGYDLKVPELENPLCFTADISYRDGLGGGARDHDWSHATIGLSSEFELSENISFEPQLYYQISMDDSVCEMNDILYCYLSFKYKF